MPAPPAMTIDTSRSPVDAPDAIEPPAPTETLKPEGDAVVEIDELPDRPLSPTKARSSGGLQRLGGIGQLMQRASGCFFREVQRMSDWLSREEEVDEEAYAMRMRMRRLTICFVGSIGALCFVVALLLETPDLMAAALAATLAGCALYAHGVDRENERLASSIMAGGDMKVERLVARARAEMLDPEATSSPAADSDLLAYAKALGISPGKAEHAGQTLQTMLVSSLVNEHLRSLGVLKRYQERFGVLRDVCDHASFSIGKVIVPDGCAPSDQHKAVEGSKASRDAAASTASAAPRVVTFAARSSSSISSHAGGNCLEPPPTKTKRGDSTDDLPVWLQKIRK